MPVVFVSQSTCPYTYDVVDDLVGKNVTEVDAAKWPCSLRTLWIDIYPLVNVVRFLLSYGTCIIIIAGVVFNTLSFLVLTSKNMRKNASNLYLAYLAVYDTCTLTFNFMIGVIRGNSDEANRQFQQSESLCTFHGVVVELFNLLSVWVIVAFTVERFMLIKIPLKARTWSPRKSLLILMIISALMSFVSCHKIVVSGFEGDSVFGYKACKTRRRIFTEIMYIYVALNTWLPTSVIVFLNMYMILELRRNMIQRSRMVQTLISKADEKATRLLLAVSSTYVLFVLPLGIVQSVELIWNSTMTVTPDHPHYIDFMSTKIKLKWTRAFFFFFYQINFVINFFLYASASSATRFMANLRSLFGMKQANKESIHTGARNAVAPAPSTTANNVDDAESNRKKIHETET